MQKHATRIVVFAIAFFQVAGKPCLSQEKTKDFLKVKKTKLNSQSTPRETYEGHKNSSLNLDFVTAFKYMTEDSQKVKLGTEVYAAYNSLQFSQVDRKEKEKRFDALLKKHGIDIEKAKKPIEDGIFPAKKVMALVSHVKNKGECFYSLIELNAVSLPKEFQGDDANDHLTQFKNPRIGKVKIEGNKATVIIKYDSNFEETRIYTKIKKRWYIDLMATIKARTAD